MMNNNSLEGLTAFLKNIPPTRAVLVEESLTAIALVVRSELVALVNMQAMVQPDAANAETPVLTQEPPGTEAWIAHVRQAFRAHGVQIETLAAETPELAAVVLLIKCQVQTQGTPGPGTDQMVLWLERIIAYLEKSSAMLTDLRSLTKTVNAVMREHEE